VERLTLQYHTRYTRFCRRAFGDDLELHDGLCKSLVVGRGSSRFYSVSHIMSSFVLAAAFWLSCLPYIYAFYLPGAAPHNFIEGEKVDLFVNALTPMLSGAKSAKIVCTYSLSLSTSQTCNRNLSSIVRDTFPRFC
jgi:hypothetical protein